ncbi:MAG TPA: DMT family transporter [Burkholderiales bacterium]
MNTGTHDHLPQRLWWVLAGLTLVWGFNWTAMKVALTQVSPWTFRALCLGLGGLVLIVALRAGGQRLASPKGHWRRLMLLALFNITGWNVLVAFGLQMIPAGRAAILGYTMPALAIPLSIWLLGERPTPQKLLGLALGMAGLALLMGEAAVAVGTAPLGSLLVLGAAASWALGVVLQKKYPVDMPPGSYTAWIMLLGGLPMIVMALLVDDLRALGRIDLWPALGVVYNVFLSFGFAYWAWIKIATQVSVTVFSISTLIIPVVGVLSGMLFLGERPSLAEFGALALVLGSLLTVVIPPRASRG